MLSFTDRATRLFSQWVKIGTHYPRRVLGVSLLVLMAFASQLPGLRIDTDASSWLRDDHPTILEYRDFLSRFGDDRQILIGVGGGDVFDPARLARLGRLHEQILATVPHVDRVESVVNARTVYGTEDELIAEDLIPGRLGHASDMISRDAADRARNLALGNPTLVGRLVAADGQFTTILIHMRSFVAGYSDEAATSDRVFETDVLDDSFDVQVETAALPRLEYEDYVTSLVALRSVLAEYRADDFDVVMAGRIVLALDLYETLMDDYVRLTAISLLAAIVLLILIFRSWSGLCIPFVIMVSSLVSCLGLMAFFDAPLQLPTLILPSLLIALSLADAIHVLSIYYQRIGSGGREVSRSAAIRGAIEHAAVPILFTSLTTAGGFLSFAASEMAPIADIGKFAPIGVMFAFVYTIVLLPPLLTIFAGERIPTGRIFSARLLVGVSRIAIRHPYPVVAATAAALTVAGAVLPQLAMSQDQLKWLPESFEIRRATRVLEDELAGTEVLEIVVELNQGESFTDPTKLFALERMLAEISALGSGTVSVGKSLSLVDVVKELNRALNENRATHYRLPNERALISQELLLFEQSGREDLDQLARGEYTKVRATVVLNRTDALHYVPVLADIKRLVTAEFPGAKTTLTGGMVIEASSFSTLLTSMSRSYIILMVVIVPLMMVLVRSFKAGCLSMVPNFLPVLLCLGTMAWLGITLNAVTMLLAGIAVGLIVDDTIHFLHHFKRYLALTGTVEEAVARTIETAGRAIFFTTIIMVTAALLQTTATLPALRDFGGLLALIIGLAFIADVVVMPALVRICYTDREE